MVKKKSSKKDLDFITQQQREMVLLGQTNALFGWDQEVNLTKAGIEGRAEQSALISKLSHDRRVSEELFDSVKRLKNSKLAGDNKKIVDKLYKSITQSRKIPHSLVEEEAKATMRAGPAWREARKKKDFAIFAPHLEAIVKIKRKYAKLIGLSGHAYNSLLDDFEEGMTVEKLTPIFDKLKYELVELLKKIEGTKKFKNQKRAMTAGKFDVDKQKFFVEGVSRRMGLSPDESRIDVSEHPFTTKIGLGDVRFTTAYRENGLFAFEAAIHEAGHALYELGMPEKLAYTAIGDSPSLGLHESQSRFWENMIGKSKAFWKFYYPKFKDQFNLKGTFDKWYDEINMVEPGMIRVEADEVHYCLHIILRFEIEKGLVDGTIKVKDLPEVWNSKVKEYFGKKPKNIVEGVLQDVHWSMGAMGYFPTYAIGTMYSAQIYDALKKQYSGVEKAVEKGKYGKIGSWLQDNVHKHGSRFLAEEIIKKACGQGLNPNVFVSYLNKKYSEIYGF